MFPHPPRAVVWLTKAALVVGLVAILAGLVATVAYLYALSQVAC